MKRTLIIAALLSLLIVLAGTFTYAQRQKGERKGNIHEKMIEKLNLTEQQQTQIDEFRFDHQEKMIDLKADVEKKKLGLKELQSSGNFTREDYIAQYEEIISAQNKIKLAKANHHMDVYELLDAEQQKTWIKMKMMKDGKHNKMKKHHKNMKQF